MHGLSTICIFALYVGGVGIYTFLLIIGGVGIYLQFSTLSSEEETWVDNALDENV